MTTEETIYGLVHRVDGVLLADENKKALDRAVNLWMVHDDPDYCVRALTAEEKATLVPNGHQSIPRDRHGRKKVCTCCGTTENLHADFGSGGPYRCNSPDCIVF